MLESTQSFSCPYCAAGLTITIDLSGGKQQKFVYDCETCCSPIVCRVEVDGEEVLSFSAECES